MNAKNIILKALFFVASCSVSSYATTQAPTPPNQPDIAPTLKYVTHQITTLTNYIKNPEKSPYEEVGIATCLQIAIEDQLAIVNTQKDLDTQYAFYKEHTWEQHLSSDTTLIKNTPLITAIHHTAITDYLTHYLALLDCQKNEIQQQHAQSQTKCQRLQATLAAHLSTKQFPPTLIVLLQSHPKATTAYKQAMVEANKAITTPKSQSNTLPFTKKELLYDAKLQLNTRKAYKKDLTTTTKEPISITYERLYEGIIQKWYTTLSEESTINTTLHTLLANSIQDLHTAFQIEITFAHHKLTFLNKVKKTFATPFFQEDNTYFLNCAPHQASAGSQAWQMIRLIAEESYHTTLYLAEKQLQMQIIQHLSQKLALPSYNQTPIATYATQPDPKPYLHRLTTPNNFYHKTQHTLCDIWQACQQTLGGTQTTSLFHTHLQLYKEKHTHLYNWLVTTLQVGHQATQEKAIADGILGIMLPLKSHKKILHNTIQLLTQDLASAQTLLKTDQPTTFTQFLPKLSLEAINLLERIQQPTYPQPSLRAQQEKAQQDLLIVIKHQIKMLYKERQTLGKIGDLNLSLANKTKILSDVDDEEDPETAQKEKELLSILFDALAPQQHTAALQAISLKLTSTTYQQAQHKPVPLKHITHPKDLHTPSRQELQNTIENLQNQQQTFLYKSELYQTYATSHPIILNTPALVTLLQTLASTMHQYANSYYLPMAAPQSTLAARRYRAQCYTQVLHITNGLLITIYQHHRQKPKEEQKSTLPQILLNPIPMILLSKGGETLIMNRGKLRQASQDLFSYHTLRSYGTAIGTTIVNEKILTTIFQSSFVNRIIQNTALYKISHKFNTLSTREGFAKQTYRYLTHAQNHLWNNTLQTSLGLMIDYPYYTIKSRQQGQPLHELFDPSFTNIFSEVLCTSLIDAAAATGANAIGIYYQSHKIDHDQQATWYGYCTHKMLHALLGGSIASLHQYVHTRDIGELLEAFLTGAQSGMVAEVVTESFFNAFERTLSESLKATHNTLEAQSDQAEQEFKNIEKAQEAIRAAIDEEIEQLNQEIDAEIAILEQVTKANIEKLEDRKEKRNWFYHMLFGTKDLDKQIDQANQKLTKRVNALGRRISKKQAEQARIDKETREVLETAAKEFNQKQQKISQAAIKATQEYQTNAEYKLKIAGSLGKIAALSLAATMHQDVATAYKAADNAIENNAILTFAITWGIRAYIAYNWIKKAQKIHQAYLEEGSEVAVKHLTSELVEELVWMVAFAGAGKAVKSGAKVGKKATKFAKKALANILNKAGIKRIKPLSKLVSKQSTKKVTKETIKKTSKKLLTETSKKIGKQRCKILVQNRENGKRAEEIVKKNIEGIIESFKSFQTPRGTLRFPDAKTASQLIEIKYVKKLSLTAQLKDYIDYARQQGLQLTLYISDRMNQLKDLSGPLRKQIKAGNIVLKTYKFNPAL